MQRAIAAVIAGFALACAAPGVAATPTVPGVAALQKQVKALATQVRVLQKQVSTLRHEVDANYAGDTCLAAVAADGLQGTWAKIDEFAGKPVFGPQKTVNDKGACGSLKSAGGPAVKRAANPVPPDVTVFTALINWLFG